MKKKFEIPELVIISFTEDDIITGSGPGGGSYPNDPGDENEW